MIFSMKFQIYILYTFRKEECTRRDLNFEKSCVDSVSRGSVFPLSTCAGVSKEESPSLEHVTDPVMVIIFIRY